MRVTNAFQVEQAIGRIQGNLARLAELQSQVSTGKRFTRVAEDPFAASQVLRVERGLRAIDQYARNAAWAQVRLGAEQAVVEKLDALLRSGRDLALSMAHGDPPFTPAQASERQVAADQLSRLLDDAVALANTRIGGEYILAGSASTTPPFDPAPGPAIGTYQGDSVARRVAIADGVLITPNHSGDRYVEPAIAALRALRDAVDPANAQPESQVQAAVQTVLDAGQQLQVSLAETGSTGAQIGRLQEHQTRHRHDLETVRANHQDVPLEEAVTRLLSLQTTIEASYAATSRLLSLSLAEYLR